MEWIPCVCDTDLAEPSTDLGGGDDGDGTATTAVTELHQTNKFLLV